jgi:hypothetical protein
MKSGIAKIKVIALDGAAQPIGAPAWAKKTDTVWRIPIGAVTTPWYLLQPETAR